MSFKGGECEDFNQVGYENIFVFFLTQQPPSGPETPHSRGF